MWALVRTLQHLREYGSFKLAAQDRGRLRSNRIANIEEAVLSKLDRTLGRVTVQCDVSESSSLEDIQRTTVPLSGLATQLLTPTDLPRRQNFCE
ncbi:hypothetical protein Zmor_001498 [Zophobas morio]|uniref:Uncharacterized protein n=1 Tax=Zophobas morio TaxID=2755281 RepID=A0AA38J7A9_9CUCU|nr:hypothetical protein Zmor_001498 [Zophobas morio]